MLVIIVGGIPIAMPTVLSVTLALGAFKLAKVRTPTCTHCTSLQGLLSAIVSLLSVVARGDAAHELSSLEDGRLNRSAD